MYRDDVVKIHAIWVTGFVACVGIITFYHVFAASLEAQLPPDPQRYLKTILKNCRNPGSTNEMEMCRVFIQKLEKMP